MAWWHDLWKTDCRDWTFAKLDATQVPGSAPPALIRKGAHYVSVFLQSARIVDVRKGLTKFYGTVHSHIRVPHRSGTPAEFNLVVAPTELKNVDAKNIDKMLSFRHRLLGPVPYHGGDVDLEVGVFSVRSADLAEPYISLLESISRHAGVGQLSAALPFAEPLKLGINLLAGGADASMLEIGVSTSALEMETGYRVAIRAKKGELDASSLRLDPVDWRLLGPDGTPVGNYPYLVLSVEASDRRDDWFELDDLKKPYAILQEAVRSDDQEAVADALASFRLAAVTCFDLLIRDADSLARQVKAETELQMPATLTGGRRKPELKQLADYRI